jgi:hypothetical protein
MKTRLPLPKGLALVLIISVISQTSCTKVFDVIISHSSPKPGFFFEYRIRQGNHTADFNSFIPFHNDELKFTVRFDSSAIYQTADPLNQYDVNKLYGFADNDAQHHEYSARIGWNWNHGSLNLYAYVYNAGVLTIEEITSVSIGSEYVCSIKAAADQYIFTVDNTTKSIPRSATSHSGNGYKLYPYFGGDETAPHDIRIWIKE